jgi:hypothetical protein
MPAHDPKLPFDILRTIDSFTFLSSNFHSWIRLPKAVIHDTSPAKPEGVK